MENSFESLLAPVKELNDLTLKSIEKIAAVQMKLIQENTRISADSMKAATEIKDFETLQTYLQGQIELAQSLSEKARKDAEEIVKLGQSYADEVKQVVEKSIQDS